VSLVCPSPVADVLAALHRDGDVDLAGRRLRGEPVRSVTFDHEVRSVRWQSVAAQLAAYDAILGLELELAERDPYRDVARAWQLVARRAGRE